MAGSGNTGLTRIIKAFGFSMQGLKAAYSLEEAFRQEIWLLIITLPLALWLGETGIEKALLIGSILLLLIVEQQHREVRADRCCRPVGWYGEDDDQSDCDTH